MDIPQDFVQELTCTGWLETFLDIFVIVKAIVLIYFSVQGITWFLKHKFIAVAVVFVLIVSCFLVSVLNVNENSTIGFFWAR